MHLIVFIITHFKKKILNKILIKNSTAIIYWTLFYSGNLIAVEGAKGLGQGLS